MLARCRLHTEFRDWSSVSGFPVLLSLSGSRHVPLSACGGATYTTLFPFGQLCCLSHDSSARGITQFRLPSEPLGLNGFLTSLRTSVFRTPLLCAGLTGHLLRACQAVLRCNEPVAEPAFAQPSSPLCLLLIQICRMADPGWGRMRSRRMQQARLQASCVDLQLKLLR